MTATLENWSLDRELVLTRLYHHPIAKVFAAWTDPQALAQWYAPEGLRVETHVADIRPGGVWQFDMVGHFDGQEQRFANLMRFIEIVPNARMVMDYGTPEPNDPDRFRFTVTFDAQGQDKTIVTLRQLHPSAERRKAVIAFGAFEYGNQTLDKLEGFLSRPGA